MRKSQEKIIKRAERHKLPQEKIEILKSEEMHIARLDALYHVFNCIPDWPIDKAIEYVNGLPKNRLNVAAWSFLYDDDKGKSHWLKYSDIILLPEELQNEPWNLHQVREFYASSDASIPFDEFCVWYKDNAGTYEGIFKPHFGAGASRTKNLPLDYLAYVIKIQKAVMPRIRIDYKEDLIQQEVEYMCSWNPLKTEEEIRESVIKRDVWGSDWNIHHFYNHHLKFDKLKECYRENIPAELVIRYIFRDEECPIVSDMEKLTAAFKDVRGYGTRFEYKTPALKSEIEGLLKLNLQEVSLGFYVGCKEVTIDKNSDCIACKLYRGSQASIKPAKATTTKKGKKKVSQPSYLQGYCSNDARFIIYPGGYIYFYKSSSNRAKFKPASLRQIIDYADDYDIWYVFETIIEKILNENEREIAKRVIKEYRECEEKRINFPPFIWNNIIGKANIDDFMAAQYKNATMIDWDLVTIPQGYAVLKAMSITTGENIVALIDSVAENNFAGSVGYMGRSYASITRSILSGYLLGESKKHKHSYDEDYLKDQVKTFVNEQIRTLNDVKKLNINTCRDKFILYLMM